MDWRNNLSDYPVVIFMVSLAEYSQSSLFQPVGFQFVLRITQDQRSGIAIEYHWALLAVVIPPLFAFLFFKNSTNLRIIALVLWLFFSGVLF